MPQGRCTWANGREWSDPPKLRTIAAWLFAVIFPFFAKYDFEATAVLHATFSFRCPHFVEVPNSQDPGFLLHCCPFAQTLWQTYRILEESDWHISCRAALWTCGCLFCSKRFMVRAKFLFNCCWVGSDGEEADCSFWIPKRSSDT
jgi:hypothetical protein